MSSISQSSSKSTTPIFLLKKKDSPKKQERIKRSDSHGIKEGGGKRDSGDRTGSFFKMKSVVANRYSHIMTEGERLAFQTSFNYSPRINPLDIDAIAKQIETYLGEDFPPLLSQILGQISYNQYAFISSNSHILAAGLAKEALLKPFLLGIARLTAPGSFLSLVRSRRLIEAGIRIIAHPSTQPLIHSKEIQQEIDHILCASAINLKSPKFQELIYQAKAAFVLHEKKQKSSKELANEGLSYLSLLIRDSADIENFKKIQRLYQHDHFAQEKAFLFSVNDFFLRKKYSLRINDLEQESLIHKCLNIFLSDQGEELVKLEEINQIAQKILEIDLSELIHANPEIEDLARWTKILLNAPSNRVKREESSFELADKGLMIFTESLLNPQDLKTLKEIECEHQNSPLAKQIAFLLSTRFFLLKRKRIEFDLLQQESLIQLSLKILMSFEKEQLLDSVEIKKMTKEIFELDFTQYKHPETAKLLLRAKIQINSSLISLQELQFLLFWIQSELPKIDNISHLVAGTREWDPEGELYQFALWRTLDLAAEPNTETDALSQLLSFILYWREAPANQDLLKKPNWILLWRTFIDTLERQNEVRPCLNSDLFQRIKQSGLPNKEIPLPEIGNPVFNLSKSIQAIPEKPLDLWNKKTIIKDLRDSLIFHILKTRQSISTKDLVLSSKGQALLFQAESFNKITQFLVGQILASQSEVEMKHIIHIICLLQLELLKYSAFEAALAVHAAIEQASVIRLKFLFSKTESFFELFEDARALCFQQKNAIELRNLQSEDPKSLEAFCIIRKDLEFLRVNSSPFTKDGKIDPNELHLFGKLFNHFATHKQEALYFWTMTMQIAPHSFILKAIESQSGQITSEQDDAWWSRSGIIHPEESNLYWGTERLDAGKK